MAMRTAAIYARFSCSKQREASISDQIRVCREWCEREGYEVVATYADEAISGRTDNRPEFRKMIEAAGESDIVLVYAFDRFSRDVYDAPRYKMELSRKGVHLYSATETLPEGPEGILMDKLYEGFAAMESARIARRTRRGMEGNALKCLHNGVAVYGYALASGGTYVVNDDEAAIVRETFARRLAGENMNHIASDLAARGVRTPRGNPCNYSMVRTMLRNEKYTGVYLWGDVRVEGGMPQIVSREEFDMTQRVRSRKVRAEETWDEYVLVGRAYCYECGRQLVGVSGHGGYNKKKYTYYRCGDRCGCKPVRQSWLESAIVDTLRALLDSRETALEIAEHVAENFSDSAAEERVEAARKSAADAARARANLMRAIEDGLPFASVSERLTELEAQERAAKSEIEMWSGQASLDVESFADFLQAGKELDDRRLLDAFVYQVWLSTDLVIVLLNWSVEKGEPARFEFARGFAENDFGSPVRKLYELDNDVSMAACAGIVAVVMPRALRLPYAC